MPNRYNTLIPLISEVIRVSGYKTDRLSKKFELSLAAFTSKIETGSWSAVDIEKLMCIINSDEVDDHLILQLMRAAKKENTLSADEFRNEIQKWGNH